MKQENLSLQSNKHTTVDGMRWTFFELLNFVTCVSSSCIFFSWKSKIIAQLFLNIFKLNILKILKLTGTCILDSNDVHRYIFVGKLPQCIVGLEESVSLTLE